MTDQVFLLLRASLSTLRYSSLFSGEHRSLTPNEKICAGLGGVLDGSLMAELEASLGSIRSFLMPLMAGRIMHALGAACVACFRLLVIGANHTLLACFRLLVIGVNHTLLTT